MKASTFNRYGLLIVYSIAFIILNVLIFVIFKPQNFEESLPIQGFWWSYGFMTVAFLLQFATVFLIGIRKGVPAIFMGMPLFVISMIYFIIEFVVSLLFMILAAFGVPTPLELVTILQSILLAAFLIIAVLALMAKNTINKIEETRKQAVTNIRMLTADVEVAADSLSAEYKDLKKEVMKLSEDIKYSDPMSVPAISQLDERISDYVMQLKLLCQDSQPDNEAIMDLIRKTKLAIQERNKKIALSK